jgi:cytochrome P450
MLNPSFSGKSVSGYEPALQRNADNFVAKLKVATKEESRINITKWFHWVAFDIVGDVIWGTPFDCVDEQRNHPCFALSMDLVKVATLVVLVARLNAFKVSLIKVVGVEGKFVDMARSKCRINRRTETETEKGDTDAGNVFSNLMRDGDVMTQVELDGNLSALVVAGSETTGFTMTTTSFYLARNPDWFHKVTGEGRGAFASEAEIIGDALKKLPILKACIDEALRFSPAAPNGLAREVVSEGEDIRGYFVPRGVCLLSDPLYPKLVSQTSVYVSQHAANHHSSHFHLPREYHPERWLGDPAFSNDKLDAVQPFIMGTNVCIGRSMAWMEMRVILAKMLWDFDFTVDEQLDGQELEREKAYHLGVKGPLHIRL